MIMNKEAITKLVIQTISEYCESININSEVKLETALVGSNRLFDSMGLVNIIVDIESSFLDLGFDVTLTSESAMSTRLSPFRTVTSLVNFISNQLGVNE